MSTNIELVTSHQGSPHITVDQVRDLLAGCAGDLSGIKVFSNLDNAMEVTILGATSIQIATGQALAGGFFFQLLDAYAWELDPGAVGYSRVDSLYLVIFEDSETLVQSADFVYQLGELYPNGSTPIIPGHPTGTNIKETFEFVRTMSSDGSIVSVESKFTNFIANSDLMTLVQSNTDALNGLRFGIDSQGRYGYKKVGADAVTPFRNPQGNATAKQVLEGYTFANANNDQIAGAMRNYETVDIEIDYNDITALPYIYVYPLFGYIEMVRIVIDKE